MENDKGEKEILVDIQSFQLGYRTAIKDMVGEPRSSSFSPVVSLIAFTIFFYVVLSLIHRDN